MVKSQSIRSDILEMLKAKFGGLSFWKRVEPEIAVLCADLPEATDEEKQKILISKLKQIRDFFISQNVPLEDLDFIDDEIERQETTKTISLYREEEDSIDPIVIRNYARLGKNTEGIVGIHQNFNYNQLKKLTNGVYEKTGLIKFYISKETTISGKIVAEIYEYAQKIPIAYLAETTKENKETFETEKRIFLFGEFPSRMRWIIKKEINIPFYVYRFITEGNDEFILLTTEQHEIGDYIVTGVKTQITDLKALTDSAKLTTKLPFFFAQEIKNRIVKYHSHKEFFNRIKYLGITTETLFDFPFTISVNNKNLKLLQPIWYKWFIWSWLTHQEKGMINPYPLHILQLGVKHSGKSLLLNTLYARSKETRPVFSGSSSTLKHLVPSFKYNPAKIGYLAESNRFSFCDEFLRCLVNTRTTKEGSSREESVALMNDLLEHQKRLVGSGVSSVNVNMTARIFATTNPIREIRNVEDLINSFDESFLSRWIVYYQSEDHVNMIRKSRDSMLEVFKYKIETNDWISLLDYLHTFSAEYDMKKVDEIFNAVPDVLTENLKKHYDARHIHHIECIIDGIIKTRCMLTGDDSFKAKEEDYKILKDIWLNIVSSWINLSSLKNIEKKDRIFYLPENCQYIYWKMVENKKSFSKEELEEMALKAMSLREYYSAWATLKDMELVVEQSDKAKLYYFKNEEENKQSRL
jgi:hypothetical protein